MSCAACNDPPPPGETVATPTPIEPPASTPKRPYTTPQPAKPPPPKSAGTRFEQCNRLIKKINAVQKPLTKLVGSDASSLRQLSAQLHIASGNVKVVHLDDPELIKIRDDYAKMSADLAKAAGDTATALDKKDAKAASIAANKMSSYNTREAALIRDVNRVCGPHTAR